MEPALEENIVNPLTYPLFIRYGLSKEIENGFRPEPRLGMRDVEFF